MSGLAIADQREEAERALERTMTLDPQFSLHPSRSGSVSANACKRAGYLKVGGELAFGSTYRCGGILLSGTNEMTCFSKLLANFLVQVLARHIQKFDGRPSSWSRSDVPRANDRIGVSHQVEDLFVFRIEHEPEPLGVLPQSIRMMPELAAAELFDGVSVLPEIRFQI